MDPSIQTNERCVSPAEEDWSCEDTGEEGAVEGEESGQSTEEAGRGGGGGGECPASGGSPGERLLPAWPAGAGEAAEEDLLQEEQNGQW